RSCTVSCAPQANGSAYAYCRKYKVGLFMIGRLRGRLPEKQPPQLVVDVAGVGYEVEAPMSTIYALQTGSNEVMLFTHMVVRDDAMLLYGFATRDERRLFRELIRVSGIGPKLALTIL